jgi:broad specificity phosphatase PhoE
MVRHSERLDEADAEGWRLQVELDRSGRHPQDVSNDPPLTLHGATMARDACSTLRSMTAGLIFTRIHCSHTKRCIQTAVPFAITYRLPIHLSRQLAVSAIGVHKAVISRGCYEYCSLDDIRESIPRDVILIEEDVEEAEVDPTSVLKHPINWKQAVTRIASAQSNTLLIAHRETIREFIHPPTSGKARVSLPYCAIASFEFHESSNELSLSGIVDKDGSPVRI